MPFEAPCRLRHEPGRTQIPRALPKPPHGRSRPSIASQALESVGQLCREIRSFPLSRQCSVCSSKSPVCVSSDTNFGNSTCWCSSLWCSCVNLPASICHLFWGRQPCVPRQGPFSFAVACGLQKENLQGTWLSCDSFALRGPLEVCSPACWEKVGDPGTRVFSSLGAPSLKGIMGPCSPPLSLFLFQAMR